MHFLIDLVLHLDRHLVELLAQYGTWIYLVLAFVVFAETGFVVTPFLPGDSLLFGVGALAAVDASHTLHLGWLLLLLAAAAIAGNLVNFAVGHLVGPRAWSIDSRWLRRRHLERTQAFFARHGGLALVLARFVPVVRTFMPFVAGVGRMDAMRFAGYTVAGGCAWVTLFLCGGYLFGNLAIVKANFGLVTIAIILASVVPLAVVAWRERGTGGTRG
jgi:membrane-associated protein